MRWALAIGRILDVPVEIHWTWPPVFAFVVWLLARDFFPRLLPHSSIAGYWSASFATSIAVFACLLAHEFGHVIVARSRGLAVPRVRLFLLGAVVEIDVGDSSSGEELALAGAGPGVSVILGSAFGGGWLLTGRSVGLFGVIVLYLALCNLLIASFNLLPGFPLDGGRLLRAVLWRLMNDRVRATRWARRLGFSLGAMLIVGGVILSLRLTLGVGVWLGLVGIFLADAARQATIHS